MQQGREAEQELATPNLNKRPLQFRVGGGGFLLVFFSLSLVKVGYT